MMNMVVTTHTHTPLVVCKKQLERVHIHTQSPNCPQDWITIIPMLNINTCWQNCSAKCKFWWSIFSELYFLQQLIYEKLNSPLRRNGTSLLGSKTQKTDIVYFWLCSSSVKHKELSFRCFYICLYRVLIYNKKHW
jgi:hypothetical protein